MAKKKVFKSAIVTLNAKRAGLIYRFLVETLKKAAGNQVKIIVLTTCDSCNKKLNGNKL